MNNPKISVIVPCFNLGSYLNETLDSVVKQTTQDWECIIINDGSSDQTHEIALSYVKKDPRFNYIEQENIGLSASRNKGLHKARGKFIQFLDADDLIDPNKIAYQLALLETNPEFDVAYSDFDFFYDKDRRIFSNSPEQFKAKYSTGDLWEILLTGNFIVIHAALTRKDAIVKAGLFDPKMVRCEDYDLWLRIANKGGKFIYSGGSLAFYRVRIDSMTSNVLLQLAAILDVIHKIPKYHTMTRQTKTLVKKYISSLYRAMAVENIKQSKYSQAMFAAIRSFCYDPKKYNCRQILQITKEQNWF